ncbi:hypothetical protein ABPG77_009788 [Micractinium sp. CCAP 211/92]
MGIICTLPFQGLPRRRADGSPLGSLLYCVVCRPGTVPVGDRYRQECLPTSLLQCAASGGGTGCSQCRRGSKMITATRAPAAYSLASRPQQGGFCPGRWDAANICRTCTQLGCPRRCRNTAGCTSCPRGSVLLNTGPPLNMKNIQWWGYCSASAAQVYRLPKLPKVCLSVRKASANGRVLWQGSREAWLPARMVVPLAVRVAGR